MIHFDLPKEQSSIIKVIGVGGGGSNAVNHMFAQKIEGVNFIICNTDAQSITQSKVPNKIQLGPHLTQGLGAGANPNIGRQATEESLEEIKRILEVNTKMAFITAGMGGGTGTGGAPILAKVCKDLGILTVGIVTTPFAYEGKKRLIQAEEGIALLKENVDTLLVISNDKLRHQFGNLKMKEAFSKADNVLATAAKCITDVINSTGQINVDFADVCTVMRNGGVAILGSAMAEGENRALRAIEDALNSPLLNDNDIRGAKWILININSAEGDHEFTMDEVEIIQDYLLARAGDGTDVILGLGYDNTLGEHIGITLIATGFEYKDPFAKEAEKKAAEQKENKIVMTLDMNAAEEKKVAVSNIELQPDVKEELVISAPEIITETLQKEEQEPEKIIMELAMPDTAPAIEEPVQTTQIESVIMKAAEPEKSVEILSADAPVFFEISSSEDQTPAAFVFDIPVFNDRVEVKPKEEVIVNKVEPVSDNTEADAAAVVSGGYLAKPTNIYVSDEIKKEEPAQELTIKEVLKEAEPETEMQMIMKETNEVIKEEPITSAVQNTTLPIATDNAPIEDETEEALRRRAAERIAKLRNLSFNVNATDPNNEYETVPAYLRRNMEVQNSLADVESFYSNYTIKSDENNQAEISTINTFLEGKKPD